MASPPKRKASSQTHDEQGSPSKRQAASQTQKDQRERPDNGPPPMDLAGQAGSLQEVTLPLDARLQDGVEDPARPRQRQYGNGPGQPIQMYSEGNRPMGETQSRHSGPSYPQHHAQRQSTTPQYGLPSMSDLEPALPSTYTPQQGLSSTHAPQHGWPATYDPPHGLPSTYTSSLRGRTYNIGPEHNFGPAWPRPDLRSLSLYPEFYDENYSTQEGRAGQSRVSRPGDEGYPTLDRDRPQHPIDTREPFESSSANRFQHRTDTRHPLRPDLFSRTAYANRSQRRTAPRDPFRPDFSSRSAYVNRPHNPLDTQNPFTPVFTTRLARPPHLPDVRDPFRPDFSNPVVYETNPAPRRARSYSDEHLRDIMRLALQEFDRMPRYSAPMPDLRDRLPSPLRPPLAPPLPPGWDARYTAWVNRRRSNSGHDEGEGEEELILLLVTPPDMEFQNAWEWPEPPVVEIHLSDEETCGHSP